MEQVLIQTQTFEANEIVKLLKSIDRNLPYTLEGLVYYPYYLFEFKMNAKGLMRLKGNIGCTVDSISGRGAMIDQKPSLYRGEIPEKDGLRPSLTVEAAYDKANEYLFHTASLKLKFVSMPQVQLVNQALFYRPFWIVTPSHKEEGYPNLMVDGISGTYHPI
ncbi:hypothetical protein [Halalkalibacter alkalisediminis]|uniref:Uncharacterized protein n=1 Tax=Halalkalibacter alkalisediminis TaxID=935616 RepID=A0ABV6NCC9_9BACI|nr:hypothetical protein [Halalkalibacter alkalisediminis]